MPFSDRLIASAGSEGYRGVRRWGRRGDASAYRLSPHPPASWVAWSLPGMQDEISRRTFLRATGVAGAVVTAGGAAPGQAVPPVAEPGWVDRPMRWAQLTLVEDDPGQFDLPFWLDYFRRTHSDARLPQRRRLRRLLPDRGPAPPPQPLARRPRPVRRAGRGLPRARHGRPRADRPARHLRRRPRGAPRLDRRRRRRASRAGTGPRPRCGSPAPWGRTTSSS